MKKADYWISGCVKIRPVFKQISFLMLFCPALYAFNINPVERPDTSNWAARYLATKISDPVHETMAMLAYDCYANPNECRGSAETFNRIRDGKRLAYLVTGVEWNDDPSLMLLGNVADIDKWRKWMLDAENKAKCLGKYAPAPCAGVSSDDDLLYRSHYGDLQFFHAMASAQDESALETKRKMLVWAKFTYLVGIGAIDSNAVLSSIPDVDALIKRPGWTVHYLFARNEDSKASIRKIAIGSLLHLVQDSYSDAHTARENGCNALSHNKPKILSFRLYKLQNPNEHKEADIRPVWLDAGDLSDLNPVRTSANILQYWVNNAEWDGIVQPFLEREVWQLTDDNTKPSSGDLDCFRG